MLELSSNTKHIMYVCCHLKLNRGLQFYPHATQKMGIIGHFLFNSCSWKTILNGPARLTFIQLPQNYSVNILVWWFLTESLHYEITGNDLHFKTSPACKGVALRTSTRRDLCINGSVLYRGGPPEHQNTPTAAGPTHKHFIPQHCFNGANRGLGTGRQRCPGISVTKQPMSRA